MPIVTMPDGVPVEFPDEMPPEQIRSLIAQKFPSEVKSLADPAQVPIGTTGVQDVGRGTALALGAAQGAGANFADETAGILAAAGRPVHAGPFSVPATALKGGAKLLYDYLTGSDTGTTASTNVRDAIREATEAAKEQYPNTFLGSEVVGAVASPLSRAVPLARGANWIGRAGNAAVNAGIYGGASGLGSGENIQDRLANAAIGTGVGIGAGAIGTPAVEGLGKVIGGAGKLANRMLGSPFSTLAQYRNPEGVAGKAVAGVVRNAETTGDKTALTRQQFERAQAAGEPVAIMDMAGDAGRNLGRAVKNEPGAMEGRQALQEMTQGRFLDENKRFAQDVRQLSVGLHRKSTDDLLEEAAPLNSANYKAAHKQAEHMISQKIKAEGDVGDSLLTPGMRNLLQTHTAQEALAKAASAEHDRTIIEGVTKGMDRRPRRFPLQVEQTPNGGTRVVLRDFGGSKGAFDLHAIDSIARVLRDVQSNAVQSGNKEFARRVTILRNAWLNEADTQVPLYAKARGDAMKAFKVRGFGDDIENAHQAGQAYIQKMGVRGNISKGELAKMEAVIKQFSPAEKELFRRGAGENLAYLLEKIPDNRAVWSQILASPVAIRQMEIAFGKPATRRMIVRRDLEKIEDLGRNAVMGNSTTAMQQNLQAAGLGALSGAGIGGGASVFGGNDPLSTAGATATVWSALAVGNKQLQRQVGAKVLDHIGKMLASGNPAQYEAAMEIIIKNEKLYNAVRQIAHNLERSGAGTVGAETAPQIAQRVPLMIGRASEEDQPVR